MYLHDRTAMELGVVHVTTSVVVAPWREMMLVSLLVPAGHGYVDVMRVDGATLARREQEGAMLRLAFELADEPAEGCVDACFVFDTVGPLPPPVSVTCVLNVRLPPLESLCRATPQ